jgi:hypothetical protein
MLFERNGWMTVRSQQRGERSCSGPETTKRRRAARCGGEEDMPNAILTVLSGYRHICLQPLSVPDD